MDTEKTHELEQYVNVLLKRASDFIDPNGYRGSVFFTDQSQKYYEGAFIYYDQDEYHYFNNDRGNIRDRRSTESMDEAAYWVLHRIIINYYPSKTKEKREPSTRDSRRDWFAFLLSAHRAIGEYFYEREKADIEETLKKYPYRD